MSSCKVTFVSLQRRQRSHFWKDTKIIWQKILQTFSRKIFLLNFSVNLRRETWRCVTITTETEAAVLLWFYSLLTFCLFLVFVSLTASLHKSAPSLDGKPADVQKSVCRFGLLLLHVCSLPGNSRTLFCLSAAFVLLFQLKLSFSAVSNDQRSGRLFFTTSLLYAGEDPVGWRSPAFTSLLSGQKQTFSWVP